MVKSMARALVALLSCTLMLVVCKPSTNTDGDDDADVSVDSGQDADDADEPDTSTEECDDASDCDDGLPCTEDLCGAGNVCRHIPFDDRCPDEEVCREGRGCVDPNDCEVHEDCDDHVFCNGAERCVGGSCFPGEARTCDDGDDCTSDYCNTATDSCVHDPLPGCIPDADVDGGVEPFDPEVHYAGRFEILPHPNSACGMASFNITLVTLSSTADSLTVQAGSFPLTQAPRPSDESFDVTYRQSNCGDYRLVGSFTNSNIFSAQWTAAFFGACGACDNQDLAVTGVRE